MDLNDFYVEVLRDDGAWYMALVHEFDDDGIEVTFPNTQLPAATVRYDQVKPVPSAVTEQNKKPMEIGEKCEIQLLGKDGAPMAWMSASVKDARGDFFVVEYKTKSADGSEVVNNDIVPGERTRPTNNQDTMTPGCLFRYRVYPNENLEELFRASDDKSHKILKEPLSPARLYFNKATKELILLTDSPTCLKRATMMIDMHLKCLDIKSSIMRRSRTVLDRMKNTSATHSARHSCEFQLQESLMGLAIGSHGVNIGNARHIPGVTHIETDRNTNTFRIFGDTEEAVGKARAMLEFEERPVMIPRNVIGRVIGKNGTTIQNIVDRSQVLRVKVEGDKDRSAAGDEDKVPLIFTGTVESIDNAKILLDFYIAHILEIDELNDKLRKVADEINKHTHDSVAGKTVAGQTSYFHQGYQVAVPNVPHAQQRLVDYGPGQQGTARARGYPQGQQGMYRGSPQGGALRQPHMGPGFGPMQQPHMGGPRHFYDNAEGSGNLDFPRGQRRPRYPQQQRSMQRPYGGTANVQMENGATSPDTEHQAMHSAMQQSRMQPTAGPSAYSMGSPMPAAESS